MTSTPEFTITRTLHAPVSAVWKAWTDPAELAGWFHPAGMNTPPDSVHVDLREGGRYQYTMVDDATGEQYPTGGSYLTVDEPHRLVFTWASPENPVESSPVITLTLDEDPAGTLLTFHLQGIAGAPGDEYVYDGWSQALDFLAARLPA